MRCSIRMHLTKGGSPISNTAQPKRQRLEVVERGVLVNLLDGRRWSIEELAEKINDEHFAEAVAKLEDAGLAERDGGSILATQAALRGDELAL